MLLKKTSALITFLFAQLSLATTVSDSNDCISKNWYEEFWSAKANESFDKALYTQPSNLSIFQDLTLRSITGYGTQASISDKQLTNNYDPIENIYRKLPESNNYEKLKRFKQAILSIEQCFANIEDNNEYLNTAVGKRKQSKLEKELGIKCKIPDQALVIEQIKAQDLVPTFKYPENISGSGSPQGAILERNKIILRNLHRILQAEFNALRVSVIEDINKVYAQSLPENFDNNILNSNKITDTNVIYNTFNAFTDIVQTKNDVFPVSAIKNRETIIINGELKNINDYDLTGNQISAFDQFRKNKSEHIEQIMQDLTPKIQSLGILKQGAISGLSTIIKERYAEGNNKSELSALSDAIESSLNIEAKASDGDSSKEKPVETLVKIRNSLALNNKLAYMRYLALEKAQLSLTAIQIAQLKVLANEINKATLSMEKNILFYEVGDNFSSGTGEAPSITRLDT